MAIYCGAMEETLEEAAHLYPSKVIKDLQKETYMKIKFEYEFHNGSSDEKYDAKLWGGSCLSEQMHRLRSMRIMKSFDERR